MQYRSAMLRAVKASPGLGFGVIVVALRPGVVIRDRPLVFAEHVDPEPLSGMQMRMRARVVIHANQHQRWIERYRGKGVGGHTVDAALEVDRDDRHPGGELSHCSSKLRRIQAHNRRDADCNVILASDWSAANETEHSYVSTDAIAYITTTRRCIIRGNVSISEITPAAAISREA